MGNRNRRRQSSRGSAQSVDFAIAQLFRRECSRCGSEMLHWFSGSEAPAAMGAGEAGAMLAQMPRHERARAACWRCLTCGEAGAFGSTVFG